jgi:hypothetical protein
MIWHIKSVSLSANVYASVTAADFKIFCLLASYLDGSPNTNGTRRSTYRGANLLQIGSQMNVFQNTSPGSDRFTQESWDELCRVYNRALSRSTIQVMCHFTADSHIDPFYLGEMLDSMSLASTCILALSRRAQRHGLECSQLQGTRSRDTNRFILRSVAKKGDYMITMTDLTALRGLLGLAYQQNPYSPEEVQLVARSILQSIITIQFQPDLSNRSKTAPDWRVLPERRTILRRDPQAQFASLLVELAGAWPWNVTGPDMEPQDQLFSQLITVATISALYQGKESLGLMVSSIDALHHQALPHMWPSYLGNDYGRLSLWRWIKALNLGSEVHRPRTRYLAVDKVISIITTGLGDRTSIYKLVQSSQELESLMLLLAHAHENEMQVAGILGDIQATLATEQRDECLGYFLDSPTNLSLLASVAELNEHRTPVVHLIAEITLAIRNKTSVGGVHMWLGDGGLICFLQVVLFVLQQHGQKPAPPPAHTLRSFTSFPPFSLENQSLSNPPPAHLPCHYLPPLQLSELLKFGRNVLTVLENYSTQSLVSLEILDALTGIEEAWAAIPNNSDNMSFDAVKKKFMGDNSRAAEQLSTSVPGPSVVLDDSVSVGNALPPV